MTTSLCSFCSHEVAPVGDKEFNQLLYKNFGTNHSPLCARCRDETAPVWRCQCVQNYLRNPSETSCMKCDVLRPEELDEIMIRDLVNLRAMWRSSLPHNKRRSGCARTESCQDFELDPNNCQACVNGGPFFLCPRCEDDITLKDKIECPDCKEMFCDNCYDTNLGDGCHCHGDVDNDKRRFYRTLIEVVVLADCPPISDTILEDIDGGLAKVSGIVTTTREVQQIEVSARKMRGLLFKAGSEPGYFSLPEEIDNLQPAHAPECKVCNVKMADNEHGEWACPAGHTQEMK